MIIVVYSTANLLIYLLLQGEIMSAHRFRALLPSTPLAPENAARTSCGFVPCPAPLLGLFSAPQHEFIQEVYRLARERVEAQTRPVLRLPAFSSN
jgi:hypothetical protein